MRDLQHLRSLEDISSARKQLQQQSARQWERLQSDTEPIRRDIRMVTNRLQSVSHTLSSIASFFSPLSVVAPRISKGTLLLTLIKRLIRRWRKH